MKYIWHITLPKIVGLILIIIAFAINNYESSLDAIKLPIEGLNSYEFDKISLENFSALDALGSVNLKVGKEEMAKHSVVIAGITRDNIKDFSVMFKHIRYIGSFFKDYRVVLFENDSTDGTKLALGLWQELDSRVKIISKDFFNIKRPSHKFMADARNYYLDALQSEEYNNFDMLILLDMDMAYGIDIRGIEDSFSKIDRWDAVCSNGVFSDMGMMYDAFSFRNNEFPWSPEDWEKICSKQDFKDPWFRVCQEGEKYSKGIIYKNLAFRISWQSVNRLYWLQIMPQLQKIYPVDLDLVPVSSCFGGMAIYKRKYIDGCKYDSIDNDCEHVVFNQCIKDKNKGRMFLNPAQMIRYSQYGKREK